MSAALSGETGAFAPSSLLIVSPMTVADQLPSNRPAGRRTLPLASPSRWFMLSITADRRASDFARVRGLAVASLVRHVPVAQPSPVVSFNTACVVMLTTPDSRGSVLVAVPRQAAFVMR